MSAILVKGMPDSWKERLKQLAKQSRRSMNQEVLTLLSVLLEEHSVPKPKKLYRFNTPLTENYLRTARRKGRL